MSGAWDAGGQLPARLEQLVRLTEAELNDAGRWALLCIETTGDQVGMEAQFLGRAGVLMDRLTYRHELDDYRDGLAEVTTYWREVLRDATPGSYDWDAALARYTP